MSVEPTPLTSEQKARIEAQSDTGPKYPLLDFQLVELAELGQDWNGYGGEPITPAAIERCRRLHFSPMGNGGILIELVDSKHEIEVTILPSGEIAGISMDRTS